MKQSFKNFWKMNKEQTTAESQDNINTENLAETSQAPETQTETTDNSAQTTELEKLKAELAEQKDKYLRLYSEFDNYRRRTHKEKLETIKTATEDLIVDLLPVVDDMERAQQNLATVQDVAALKEGLDLIFTKFGKVLANRGLKSMDTKGLAFDADLHNAITSFPAEEHLKGKVVDEVEKGYFLNEKAIRFAKVVIGA